MRHSREPDFSFSRLKIHVFGHKLDTLCATRADPNLAFRALKSVFKIKHKTLYAPHALTRFFHFTPKVHVFGQKLDTLCATRPDPNLEVRALKSMFKVKI